MAWKIILIFLRFTVSTHQSISNPINDSIEENDILRSKFLEDKRKNNVTATRIKLLEKYAASDSVLIDDILHYKIKGHPQLKQVNKIEDEFRSMLAMDGLTYIFNRDMAWRTWRKVSFGKEARIVHYKHETSINCTKNCDTEGYWVIEKNPPPCPVEIFSIDNNAVCALTIKYYHKKTAKCSSYLFSLLTTTCDNPIVTRWIVQKTFSAKEKKQRFPVVICGGREYCKLLTVYKITADHISFKIVNSTNHIIYSRIMKSTHENYACVNDCGIFDRKTNTVEKSEKPLKLNLFKNKIEKREKIIKKPKNKPMENGVVNKERYISNHFVGSRLTTHPPSCKNLRHNHVHDDADIIDDEDVDNES